MSGVYEAVDAGVPILGVPLFYDQPRNIQNLVDIGMALSLNINTMSKTMLLKTINRLLDEKRYILNCILSALIIYNILIIHYYGSNNNFAPNL